MTDTEIINLFFERSEQAITELAKKHGSAVARVARNILGNEQDTEECVNDTYLPGPDAEHHPARLPPHLLQQSGQGGHEPKDAQYLMGHSDIGVTLNTYTHLGLEDAAEELRRMEEAEAARREQEKLAGKTKDSQKLFKAV